MNQKTSISIIVVCLLLAGLALYFTIRYNTRQHSEQNIFLLCANKDCGKSFEIKSEEYHSAVRAAVPQQVGNLGIAFAPVKCNFCGKETAWPADKCPKCSQIYFAYDVKTGDPIKCPSCGYIEQ